MLSKYDVPFPVISKHLDDALAAGLVFTFFQKWTCGNCGARQAMGEPNKVFPEGKCEECGRVTRIEGYNVVVIADPATYLDVMAYLGH